ncbi:MAG: ribonuclease III [Clostridia bacterium]|nr:ribonuclease III [Clostridia bacterium]
MFELEKIQLKLGYKFNKSKLLLTAFTHKSYRGELSKENNERLEFLGDSVLGFVISDYLYHLGRGKRDEGKMTVQKQGLVSTKPLAQAMRNLDLHDNLLLGDGMAFGGTQDDRLLENLYEAIIGALYLDGGIEVAKNFIKNSLIITKGEKRVSVDDYKSNLQIYTQSKKLGIPVYELVAKTGPDHSPQFTIAVVIGGKKIAVGNGSSKASASKEAARRALKKISRQE